MRTLKVSLFLSMVVFVAGCGPKNFSKTRIGFKPFDAKEFRQEKSGLIIENKEVKTLPAQFFASVQACNRRGQALVDQTGAAITERIALVAPGQMWFKVAISNNTEHVVRLNRSVTRLFDPAQNQLEPLSKEDLTGDLMAARPCPTTAAATPHLGRIKLLKRDAEVLPHTTYTGWLAFRPLDRAMPGIWKLALYELPVEVDATGNPTKTTRFELRSVATKYVDHYTKKPFSQPVLVRTEELSE